MPTVSSVRVFVISLDTSVTSRQICICLVDLSLHQAEHDFPSLHVDKIHLFVVNVFCVRSGASQDDNNSAST